MSDCQAEQLRSDLRLGKCVHSLLSRKVSILYFTLTAMVTAAFYTHRKDSWLPFPPHCHRPSVAWMTSDVNREECHPFLQNQLLAGMAVLLEDNGILEYLSGKTKHG